MMFVRPSKNLCTLMMWLSSWVSLHRLKYLEGEHLLLPTSRSNTMTLSEWVASTLDTIGRKASDFHY